RGESPGAPPRAGGRRGDDRGGGERWRGAACCGPTGSRLGVGRAGGRVGRRVSGAAPLPPLTTFFDRAANASLVDLVRVGRSLLARLERDGCRVNVAIERETTATR